MIRYEELKDSQGEKIDAFLMKYAFFAFNEDQFREGLRKLGVPEEEAGARLYRMGDTGGYYLKERAEEYRKLWEELDKEIRDAIHDPETGPEFAFQMFHYELLNHEYGYTGDTWETLNGLGLTLEEIQADPIMSEALEKAKKAILQNGEE